MLSRDYLRSQRESHVWDFLYTRLIQVCWPIHGKYGFRYETSKIIKFLHFRNDWFDATKWWHFCCMVRTRLIMLQSTSDDQTILDCCIIDAICIFCIATFQKMQHSLKHILENVIVLWITVVFRSFIFLFTHDLQDDLHS